MLLLPRASTARRSLPVATFRMTSDERARARILTGLSRSGIEHDETGTDVTAVNICSCPVIGAEAALDPRGSSSQDPQANNLWPP